MKWQNLNEVPVIIQAGGVYTFKAQITYPI